MNVADTNIASDLAGCELKENWIWPDECVGECDVGVCFPTRMRRYLIFWRQPAACGCTPGRRATEEEHNSLTDGDFPNLPKNGYTITGDRTTDYNCIGWSVCSRTFGWMWPQQPPYNTAAERLAFFDRMYAFHGWKPAADCRPERGKRKIALYCKDGEPTHAAKQLHEDQWTSKVGGLVRIVHVGTGALEGPFYGKVCRCYEKSLANALAEAKALLAQIQRRIAAGETGLGDAERDAQEQVRQWEADLAKEGSS